MSNKPKVVPTEDEDLQAALKETDALDDADFGQQGINDGWAEGLIDEDFDSDFDFEPFEDDKHDDDEGYF